MAKNQKYFNKKVNRTTASQSRKRRHASNETGLFSTGKLFQSDSL